MRSRIAVAIVATAVAAAGAGWIAASTITTPADLAAQAEPPEASVITVPVELRTLSSNVIVRGSVSYEQPFDIEVAAAPADGGIAVVTLAPERGAELSEGDRALEVSGRPVLLLGGDVPMYRDLGPGSRGDDVRRLQEALKRLGQYRGDLDGVYSAVVQTALEALYTAAGYEAMGPSDEQREQLKAAEESVDGAAERLRQTQRALTEGGQGPPQSAVIAQQSALRQAEDALAAAKAEAAHPAAAEVVKVLERARDEAKAARDEAAQRRQAARDGAHPDTGQPPTAEELAALGAEASAASAALADAEAELAAARVESERAAAQAAVGVRDAEDQVRIARAQLDELRAPADLGPQREEISAAESSLAAARAELATLQERIGVTAQRSELVFVAELPVRVDDVSVKLGDQVSGSVMTVTGSRLLVTTALDRAQKDLVSVGDEVQMEASGFSEFSGVITLIAERPGTEDVGEQQFYAEITPGEDAPAEISGASVKITVPVESTDGAALAVPVAALSAGPDGRSRVEVEDSPGVTRLVTVDTGLSAEGFIEIRSAEGPLEAGDRVAVGRDRPAATAVSGSTGDDGDDDDSDDD